MREAVVFLYALERTGISYSFVKDMFLLLVIFEKYKLEVLHFMQICHQVEKIQIPVEELV